MNKKTKTQKGVSKTTFIRLANLDLKYLPVGLEHMTFNSLEDYVARCRDDISFINLIQSNTWYKECKFVLCWYCYCVYSKHVYLDAVGQWACYFFP